MKLWQTSSTPVDELVEKFTAGEDVALDARLIYFDLCGTAAHVKGLGRIGLLSDDEVKSVCDELAEVWQHGLDIQTEDEDVHTAVENALIDSLDTLGQKIHTGRSRNDQVLVDLRLYAKSELFLLIKHLLTLAESLRHFAQQYEMVPMPGTTHTRHAMPSSIGMWAASFSEGLLESLTQLEAAFRLVDRSPLGAAAGYGVPLALDREYVSELLGFECVQVNPISTTSGRGKIDYAVLSALSIVMLDLSRLGTDLIWMSGEAMDFFELPPAFCTGSSIMPNKQNPDVLELIRAKAARVQADATQAFMIAQGRISGYHRDHQELKPPFMDGLTTVRDCVEILTPLVKDISVNEAQLRDAMTSELFAVDEMIEHIKSGTPMREAYRQVKEHLDAVTSPDVDAALKARSHLGGAGNLGLSDMNIQIQAQLDKWSIKHKEFKEKLAALVST